LAPYAKKYNTRYGSDGHNEHADLVEKNLAIPGLRRTLVDHLEHGDLLQSRPLPRAWRLTKEIMQAAGSVIGKRSERFELRVAVRSAAVFSGRSSGETATFPDYTINLVLELSRDC
jgi:hypothetical protein